MKVLPFTIPVPHNHTILVQDEVLPHFYSYLHRHQEIQLTLILQGEGTLITGDSIHSFGPGDIFLLGPNLPHVFKSDAVYFTAGYSKQVHALTVFFNPHGQLGGMFNLPEMQAVQLFLQQVGSGFKVPDELNREISVLMQLVNATEGADRLIRFLKLLKVLSVSNKLQPLTINVYPQTITDSEGIRIGLIYNYIVLNFDKPLTLQDAATQAYMTPQAFCRYFKKHTRHTFVGFLNKVRINEACKMLNNRHNNNIADIAYSCGFNSITNFNRVFKSVAGLTPGAYATSMKKM